MAVDKQLGITINEDSEAQTNTVIFPIAINRQKTMPNNDRINPGANDTPSKTAQVLGELGSCDNVQYSVWFSSFPAVGLEQGGRATEMYTQEVNRKGREISLEVHMSPGVGGKPGRYSQILS